MGAHEFWLAVYVMITRSKFLNGLLTLGLPDRSALEAGPPQSVREDLQRLTELHGKACSRMHSSMADFFDGDLPQDLEKLFADETALQQRGKDIDWTDIDRRLEEALQERLAPGTCLRRKTG